MTVLEEAMLVFAKELMAKMSVASDEELGNFTRKIAAYAARGDDCDRLAARWLTHMADAYAGD